MAIKTGDKIMTVAQPGQRSQIGTVQEVITGGKQTVYRIQIDGEQLAYRFRRDQITPLK